MGFRPEGHLLINTLEDARTDADGMLQPVQFVDFKFLQNFVTKIHILKKKRVYLHIQQS